MPSWQSIRFRLSIQYSALVFGLGGALLGLVYLAVQRGLRSETMMRHLQEGRLVAFEDGSIFEIPHYSENEVHAIEIIYNQVVLDEVARFTVIAVIILFLLSIVVGWIMSGRVLKPVNEITEVAREIQASDLGRRIGLEGPDDELKSLADTFDQMLQRLDDAFSSQRRFLADTSHDLRTPLTIIRSNIELVSDDPDADVGDWEKAGVVIRRNAEKMSEMIAGLLATARMETRRAEAITIDLGDLVVAKVRDFMPIAIQEDVELTGQARATLVQGVDVALDRALSNLVENALKVAPAGTSVTVGCDGLDGWAWMGVRDEGPGLPSDPGDRVGLGLSIVTQIAESHGGALVSFPGEGGRGTTMVVWLPTGRGDGSPPDSNPFTDT